MVAFGNKVTVLASATSVMLTLYTVVTSAVMAVMETSTRVQLGGEKDIAYTQRCQWFPRVFQSPVEAV